jgi:hypothetical protein
MSTEHVNEPDLEYGSTPPGAKHEHTDIDVAVGYKFALWLAVAMIISGGIVADLLVLEGRSGERDRAKFLAASGSGKAAAQLQTQPFKDIYRFAGRTEALKLRLGRQDGGVTHIPIDRAIEVMLQGFPLAWTAATPERRHAGPLRDERRTGWR